VTVDRLVEASGASPSSVRQALDPGRVELDDDGRIVEIFGVTLGAAPHRIELEQSVLFTCCALVSHVLPRLLGREIRVRSEDPVTGDSIRLLITTDGLRAVQPDGAVASMIITDETDLRKDAPLYFCNHVRHFTSRTTATGFIADNPKRYVIDLAELDAAAQRLYSAVWS
jgi:alkylmercury lyase